MENPGFNFIDMKIKLKKPNFRIVHVENDPSFGSYYKIETRELFWYRTYYFRVPNAISLDQNEFRFRTFESAKEELDMLMDGKSKYNCFSKVVYESKEQNA